MNLLLDSVILIDHFNGIDAATHYLATHHADAAISVITRAEVLAGFEEAEVRKPAQFLDSFATLGIDQATADLAASLLRNTRLEASRRFPGSAGTTSFSEARYPQRKRLPARRFPFVLIPYRL